MAKINTATVEIDLPTDELQITNMEVTPVDAKEKLFDVYVTKEFRAYIGNEWYSFKLGKASVPEHIKAYLLQVGALKAI